uniref:Uncharacterized protein n=1 Tax=Steinernema glaseri TaxID=37863 RepID=A0A1I7ZYL7_9BILA
MFSSSENTVLLLVALSFLFWGTQSCSPFVNRGNPIPVAKKDPIDLPEVNKCMDCKVKDLMIEGNAKHKHDVETAINADTFTFVCKGANVIPLINEHHDREPVLTCERKWRRGKVTSFGCLLSIDDYLKAL